MSAFESTGKEGSWLAQRLILIAVRNLNREVRWSFSGIIDHYGCLFNPVIKGNEKLQQP